MRSTFSFSSTEFHEILVGLVFADKLQCAKAEINEGISLFITCDYICEQ